MRSVLALLLLAALALPACADKEDLAPVPQGHSYTGTLAVDIRGTAAISIDVAPDGSVTASIQPDMLGAGGVLDPSTKISAPGTIEPFPETSSEMYTAKFSIPARPDSPCGTTPISLGLSLVRRLGNSHVGGSLTAYCGADHFYGVPARVLRLSGDLPKSAQGSSK